MMPLIDPQNWRVQNWRVLGIETSCDETAAAVVACEGDEGRTLSNIVRSQAEHGEYGGVVPEIAARAHVEVVDTLVARALDEAGLELADLDGIAATSGPGLLGGLLVGVTAAKALSFASGLPFVGVNHLEGHALTPGLTDGLAPPYLLLLVSGGHTQTVIVRGEAGDCERQCERLGTTLDDALGEAFDKAAKLLGLGYPGGPEVEAWAARGDADAVSLPRPMVGRPAPDFSFSGLKTALRQAAHATELTDARVADLCAAFQASVTASLTDRVGRALELYEAREGAPAPALVVAGGVAANEAIRASLTGLCAARNIRFIAPPAALCGDNAAMIAWAGGLRLARGEAHGLDLAPRARWPLDEAAAKPGAKA